MEANNEQRVRMNVKQSAKGAIQFDITAESTSPEESGKLLGEALDKVKMVIESKGYKLAVGE